MESEIENRGILSPLMRQLTAEDGLEEQPLRIDTPEEIADLERRYAALEYVRQGYSLPGLDERQKALAPITSPMHAVERITNQFGKKLLGAYMQSSQEQALATFRDIEPHTVDEELALLLADDEFVRIRSGMNEHLEAVHDNFYQVAEQRLAQNGQISRDDRYQFNGNETKRSLRNILERGVTIQIMGDTAIQSVLDVKELSSQTGVPLTELLKNQRILRANGFPDSKVSLAIHDVMDHAWGFWLMQQTGLDIKYRDLFDSIGQPALTDIYKREGEIPASICYGVRLWANQERGFKPTISATDIRDLMEEYFNKDELLDRHMNAFRILRSMTPDSREWQSLGFTYSNYVTELDEQRRKHGKIKQRDVYTHEILGELSVTDPDFLSFFVEFHDELMKSKNKHRDELFRTHLLFEEYLHGISEGTLAADAIFRVRVQSLAEYPYQDSSLDPKTIRWMFRNYGFTATKDALL